MKALFKISLIASLIAITSCSTYQRIATISSPEAMMSDDGAFFYADGDVLVTYDFWAQSGRVAFLLTNNSNSDIYVDLSRSFLVVNGLAYDYYNNRSYGTTMSSASASVVSRSASTQVTNGSAVGSGTINGYAISGGGYSFGSSAANASAYASSTTNYSSTMVTSAYSYGVAKSIAYAEKEGVWVPAHSSRIFSEFSVMNKPYRVCGFARDPHGNEKPSVDFSADDSPIVLENRIMLVVNGKDKLLSTNFYISNIINVVHKKAIKETPEKDCKGKETGYSLYHNIYRQSNRFYINYSKDSSSRSFNDDRTKARNKK